MDRFKTNATTMPTDPYNKAIAGLEESAFALVEMTVSEVRGHAESSAFTLLNMGEVGLSAMEFVFERSGDFHLRRRIIDLLRGASLTHGAFALKSLGRLMEAEDLDPLLRAIARSSFAEALDRSARVRGLGAGSGTESARPGEETPSDQAPRTGS